MKKLALGTAVACVFLSAPLALAQECGFQIGLRSGYMIPFGNAAKDAVLSDAVKGGVPIWFDIGYQIRRHFYLGAYGSHGMMSSKNADTESVQDKSFTDLRFGFNAHYHFSPDAWLDPWLGLGAGYELLSSVGKNQTRGREVDENLKGIEYANLQVGLDYKVTADLGIGPFVSFSVGQYSKETTATAFDAPDGRITYRYGNIVDRSFHEWFTIGVRGAYNL